MDQEKDAVKAAEDLRDHDSLNGQTGSDSAREAEDNYAYGSDDYGDSLFESIDVSEPRAPIKEMDIIEEALAIRRRDWIRTHLSYIYAAIGVVLVILIAFLINMFFQNSNPMSRFTSSLSKDFSSSFRFDLRLTEDDEPVMSYDGAINVNHSKHTIRAVYEADYNRYQYSGAVYADKAFAKKGSYYDKRWLVRECLDNAQDFFDFDRDFRSGSFDAGSFLRFTGLTSDFSTRELNVFVNTLMKRMSTDSTIATITTEKTDDESRYHYNVSMQALFEMVRSDGASIFYRAPDYDTFCKMYEANKSIIADAKCTIDFTVDSAGHMTALDAKIAVQGKSYGLSCRMSDFGKTEVEVPQGFLKAAQIIPAE